MYKTLAHFICLCLLLQEMNDAWERLKMLAQIRREKLNGALEIQTFNRSVILQVIKMLCQVNKLALSKEKCYVLQRHLSCSFD